MTYLSKEKNKLQTLTKEQLINKCINQKEALSSANAKITQLAKELLLKNIALSEVRVDYKVRVYMEETLSLIEDVEQLKKELKELKENEQTKNTLEKIRRP